LLNKGILEEIKQKRKIQMERGGKINYSQKKEEQVKKSLLERLGRSEVIS
jgi:hypothetical protein